MTARTSIRTKASSLAAWSLVAAATGTLGGTAPSAWPAAVGDSRHAATSAPEKTARAALLDPANPLWGRRAPEVFHARCETSQGPFEVEVRREWAPHGADRFFALAAAGFFDDSRFFRVVAGFVAQFGVAGDPAVTAAWRDRKIPDDPVRQSNVRGTIAYAMTGPGTRSTQLYVNLADNTRLDGQGFAPIGRVASGMDIVDRLHAGYGEQAGGGMRGGRQGKLLAGGNAWLDADFPKLDRLLRVRILEEPR
jgi:cyclophilin family peptidyl-prolyl cis-trans isomerase